MQSTSRPIRRLTPIILFFILVIAAGLRFYNLNWDNGIFAHPDERSTVAFYAPTIRWPDDLADILDPRASTLNPFWDVSHQNRRSYTYGHFPLYTLVLVAHFLRDLAPVAISIDLPPAVSQFLITSQSGHGYAQIGRALMALADLFTVYLVFLIGRRLYGVWAGLLAAALSAFTVLQIQLAHFFAVDPVSTTFTLLALYGAILLYERRSIGAALITGVGIALAVASKFSALPVAFAPVVAAYLTVTHPPPEKLRNDEELSDGKQSPAIQKSRLTNQMVGLVFLSLGLAFVIFALTSPFVLLDFENFKQAVLVEQGNMVRGIADFPFTRQYRNTLAYWYFIAQQVRWGMWWPLGLLAFAGLAWVIVKAVRGKAQPGEWIILWWIILYFGTTGLFLAKFMRYMVPVVPIFTLFGAGLVATLWRFREPSRESIDDQTVEPTSLRSQLSNQPPDHPPTELPSPPPRSPREKLAKGAAIALTSVALLGSAFWSFAFVNGVYGTDHTWMTFARWVYANVPDGACIAYEHWDDRMPTDIPEPGGNASAHRYFQPQLPMYDDDTQEKYQLLRGTLMGCDYIVLASNRLWRTIPRLPERYPMSSRYYDALFSGELGFEEIYAAETPPSLGPIVLDDQPADESFTVYDHPKPILFQKTRQLSEAEWDAVLGGSWVGAMPGYVGRPTLLMRLAGADDPPRFSPEPQPAEQSKSLMLDRPTDQLPVVNDFRWNSLANNSTIAAVLIWWLVVILIGLIAWPVTFLLFNNLPDRGYGLSKSLGLLLVSYLVWISSSLGWPGNRWFTAVMAVVVCFGVSIWIIVKQRQQLVEFLRQHRRLILIAEGVFALIYLFFIYLRLLNPDLWQPWLGGEKMLEIGFLNAIVKSEDMPPYDPFFAGGIINYYYYGLFLIGVLIKLTGIQPAIAFNLAVPTLAGLTALNVFSLATNLAIARLPFGHLGPRTIWPPKARRIDLNAVSAGLLAILFILFIGNLDGTGQLMRDFARLSTSEFQSAIPGVQTLVLSMGGFFHAISGETVATYNYWDPTRVIPATINEFPYFSFLFADLHPHMIGMPITVLFLSLAYNWLRPANSTIQQPPDSEPDNERKPATQPPNHLTSFQSQPPNHPPTETNSFIPTSFLSLQPSALLRWLALPFVLGAVAVINTWDLPTYLGLMLATFLLSRYRQLDQPLTLRRTALLLVQGMIFAAALLVATYLLYAPFFANYQAIDVGLGLVHTKTELGQHLKIWGLFLVVIVTWLLVSLLHPATRNGFLRTFSLGLRRWNVGPHLTEIYRKLVEPQDSSHLVAFWGIVGVLLIAVALTILGYWVPAYLLPLVALALILLFRRELSPETSYIGVLTFTGLLILLGVEFFFLRDFLGGGDYYRMNTLFKFFFQVWIIFGLVAAVALPQLWQWAWRWSWLGQLLWRGSLVILLMASLIYPVLGTRTRVDDRFPGDENRPAIGTLDGLAYMTVGSFEWPAGSPIELKYDYEAIRWLQENVAGTPVIAEAKVGYYREGGMRVAAYTGLPSVLGGLHQNEQRYSSQVGERDFVINEFWNTLDPNRALELIDRLGISYIYVGQIERITHGEHIEEKFELLHQQGALELIFENEKTKIYKRTL